MFKRCVGAVMAALMSLSPIAVTTAQAQVDNTARGLALQAKSNALLASKFQRIFRAANAAAVSNPRNAGLYAGSLTVTDNGATLPSQTSQSFPFTPTAYGVWKPTGGTPVNAGGLTRFWSATVSSTGGTVGTGDGKNANFWRVTAVADSRYLTLRVGPTVPSYRLLVNGKYASLSGTTLGVTSGNTYQYILYDFGTRATRTIALEGQGAASFGGGYVETEGKIYPVSTADAVYVSYLGDSYIEGPSPVLKGDTLGPVVGDWLGAYTHASGIGGTGWGRPTGSAYGFETRIIAGDLALGGNKPDVIFLMASVNNKNDSASLITAGVLSGIISARSQYPNTPIIVFGCTPLPQGPLTGTTSVTTVETATQAAVVQLNDPLLAFVPVASDPSGAWFTGVGSELTFSGPLTAATTGTLASNWTNGNVSYTILFSDGSTRTATFTQNSPTVTWSGAVTANAAANVYSNAGNATFKFQQDFTHLNTEGNAFLGQREAFAALAALRAMGTNLGIIN